MRKFSLFLLSTFLVVSPLFAAGENRIDMGISPIRDEFTVDPGTTVKRTIKFYNNGGSPTLIYVTTEDCVQGEDYGTPKCRTYTGTGGGSDPDNASTWIHIEGSDRFTVPARGEKDVTYTVTAPSNATPGGHYGAIFFNNPGQGSNGNAVDMVRRIGMLYLMKVPGNIIVDTQLGEILIDVPDLNSAPGVLDRLRKNLGDTSAWGDMISELNPFWEKPVLTKENLQISLNVPVQNLGNIHIKPEGKIYIYDGNEMLKKVGKESILNENGVYVGEKVVDYLPINDEQGNVLPDSERVFKVNWLGFASQEIGDNGGSIINFESPSDYFARISEDNIQVLYPWDKLSLRNATKSLTAKVDFSYKNPKTNANEASTLELPINVSYNYIAKTPNWGIILIITAIILIGWMIVRRRDTQIEELEDELDDEIAALEKAQKALLAKGTSSKKKKTVAASKATPVSIKKPAAAKKTPVKKTGESTGVKSKKVPTKKAASSSVKKPVSPTKKPTTTTKTTTTKKPVAKKSTVKKPVAKKTPTKKPE